MDGMKTYFTVTVAQIKGAKPLENMQIFVFSKANLAEDFANTLDIAYRKDIKEGLVKIVVSKNYVAETESNLLAFFKELQKNEKEALFMLNPKGKA